MAVFEKIEPYIHRKTGKEGILYKVFAEAKDHKKRLDKVLSDTLPELSRNRLQDLIEGGFVENLDTETQSSSSKVKEGFVYLVFIPSPLASHPQAQEIPLQILYEDDDLIVIDKPAGLVMHPAPGNQENTLVNALLHHCVGSLSGIGGVRRPGIVHRLDKDTSGVVVIAKNDVAHQNLTQQFSERSIKRAYKALVWGVPHPLAGQIEGNIGRHPIHRKKMAILKEGGRYSLTHYKVEQQYKEIASLIDCVLGTGRTHQIRVHLASIGHPVIGDPVYGSLKKANILKEKNLEEKIFKLKRQLLHAYCLGFIHPKNKNFLLFKSKIPSCMINIIKLFECI